MDEEGEKKNKNLNFKSCFIIIFLFFTENFSCVENPKIQGMKGEVILYYYIPNV